MTKFRVKQKLADGTDRQIGEMFSARDEAKEAILADASGGSTIRRAVAADHIDDDGLFYAGWDYGIFEEEGRR